MATTTVRVSEETHRALVEMAEHDGVTISAKVAALVLLAEEDAMLAGHEAAMERLQADRSSGPHGRRRLQNWMAHSATGSRACDASPSPARGLDGQLRAGRRP